MPPIIPPVYPITDRKLSGLSHARQVRELIHGGASFIQLREKELPSQAFFEDAERALALARSAGAKLLINDRVDLAIALGADGVHLGQDDLPPTEARKLLGEKAIIGLSTHTFEQAMQALELPVDYIAVGPIFATSTKENTDPEVGLEGIRKVRDLDSRIPIVAIGGINETNYLDVLAAGADSVAIISGVAAASDIAGTIARLLSGGSRSNESVL